MSRGRNPSQGIAQKRIHEAWTYGLQLAGSEFVSETDKAVLVGLWFVGNYKVRKAAELWFPKRFVRVLAGGDVIRVARWLVIEKEKDLAASGGWQHVGICVEENVED